MLSENYYKYLVSSLKSSIIGKENVELNPEHKRFPKSQEKTFDKKDS